MTAKNDVTGDALRSKASNQKYADGWDRIFGNKSDKKEKTDELANEKNDRKNDT